MALYEPLPIPVDAQQFLRDDQPWPPEVKPWSPSASQLYGADAWIRTAQGSLLINNTDWVLRWPDGKVTICSDDVFSKSYRPQVPVGG